MQASDKDLYRQANGAYAPVAHTPGPWVVTNPIDEEEFADIQSMNGGLYLRATWGTKCRRLAKGEKASLIRQLESDACLIAAAPDLLAALKLYVAFAASRRNELGLLSPEMEATDTEARAAIGKALGSAS